MRTTTLKVVCQFGSPEIIGALIDYGFKPGAYEKVIVSWGWQEEVELLAKQTNVTLWDFRNIVNEIASELATKHTYFTDDTMRTIQLFAKANRDRKYTS